MFRIECNLTPMQSFLSWGSSGWYAARHFQEAMKPQTTYIGKVYHVVVGAVDLLPIIGRVASFAEKKFVEESDRVTAAEREQCKRVQFEERNNPQCAYFSIILQNGEVLYLGKGKFQGNLSEALEEIDQFCRFNEVHYTSFGHGYGELTINGRKHDITPYGIDIEMMLKYRE